MEHAEGPPAAGFAQKISTPGKELVFDQFLNTSPAPEVELSYDVERRLLARGARRSGP